ncbi:MAG TPA: cytochrome C oxidase subunit IV family protein [Dehalococcoidia bacterium]|nr:cytochrome C oxidase subunit IV family protein [Dehalococcoidia bacterium]
MDRRMEADQQVTPTDASRVADHSRAAEPDAHEPGTHPHPGQGEYVRIAVILAVITAIEVGVYYVEALRGLLIPILIVLGALKFALVVMFFMHLKFDNRLFTFLFTGPLIGMILILIALLALFSATVRVVP